MTKTKEASILISALRPFQVEGNLEVALMVMIKALLDSMTVAL